MNLVLLESTDPSQSLPSSDARARHILEVLRRKPGDTFDVGALNGPRGKGTIGEVSDAGISFTIAWSGPPLPPVSVTLLIGLPRPQTARDILRDATTLGATTLHFFRPEKGESSYAQSTLWKSDEWKRHVRAGAEQAFDPHVPTVSHGESLEACIATLEHHGSRLALDNYESPRALSHATIVAPVTLAFGPERGWSAAEREMLRGARFELCHLGERVLRCETAVVAALAVIRSKLGLL